MSIKHLSLLLLAFLLFAAGADASSPADSLRLALERAENDTQKASLLKALALAYQEDDQPLSAQSYAREWLRLAQKLGDKSGMADAQHLIGTTYWQLGEFHKAASSFFDALRLREAIGDEQGLALSYEEIGNLYFRQQDFEWANYHYVQSLELHQKRQDSLGIIYALNHIANVLTEQGRYKSALANYQQAMQAAQASNCHKGLTYTHENIGRLWMRQGDFVQAAAQFDTALRLSMLSIDKQAQAQAQIHLGEAWLEMDSLGQAIAFLTAGLATAKPLAAKELQAEALLLLATANARRSCYDSAYLFQIDYHELYRSMINTEREHAILDLQQQYESEKQRAMLLETRQRIGRSHKLLLFLLLFALALITTITISRYRLQSRLNRLLKEKNQEIAQQNEALIQTNQALEQFNHITSHDLREPLRTIGSFASLLQRRYEDKLDQDARDFINYIMGGTRQLNKLLDNLLHFSKLSNSQEIPKEEVDLNIILAEVSSNLQVQISQQNALIQTNGLPTVYANGLQMYQLFQNLLLNSLKFNDKEQAVIHINYQKQGCCYQFSFQDNGIGINEQYLDKIFFLFYRLDRQQYPGTGIGLAICEKIVKRHHGKIWAESKEGQGSIFHFTLPHQRMN